MRTFGSVSTRPHCLRGIRSSRGTVSSRSARSARARRAALGPRSSSRLSRVTGTTVDSCRAVHHRTPPASRHTLRRGFLVIVVFALGDSLSPMPVGALGHVRPLPGLGPGPRSAWSFAYVVYNGTRDLCIAPSLIGVLTWPPLALTPDSTHTKAKPLTGRVSLPKQH